MILEFGTHVASSFESILHKNPSLVYEPSPYESLIVHGHL